MVIIIMLTNAISIANSKGVKNELMKWPIHTKSLPLVNSGLRSSAD